MQEQKKSRRGCWWVAILLVLLVVAAGILLLGGLALVGASLSIPGRVARAGVDEAPHLDEIWASGHGETKVVAIPLHGMILLDQESGLFGSVAGSADMALKSIRRATHDAKVRALILQIDSGGGGLTASDVLYQALQDFKARGPGRKVVSVFGDMAASGAYYVALASDHIVAHPTTVTGSIGVMMQSFNVRELSRKAGIEDVTIKSGKNKDILNPFEEVDPEQIEMLQGIVDEFHGRFVALVAQDRGLPEAEVRAFADGRVVTASDALSLGLVDQIGYWNDATQALAGILGVPQVKVFRYEERFSFSSFLKSWQNWKPAAGLWSRLGSPRFYYVWRL
jgi:protease-4